MARQRDIENSIEFHGSIGPLIASIGDQSPLGPIEGWSQTLLTTVRLLLSAKAEIVLYWGPELCAIYNEAYIETMGDKHPRALGRPAREIWPEAWDDLGPMLEQVIFRAETIHAKDRPFYIARRGGKVEQAYFDISYSPIFEDDGSIAGVLCVETETTNKVLIEKAVRADRDAFWTLARDPFLIANAHGVWVEASPAWTEILGWSLEELLGRTSEWMEHPEDNSKIREATFGLAPGETSLEFENRFRAKDGSYRHFSWTAKSQAGMIYCVARDITLARENAQALADAEAALHQAQKMETLGQLTGGVAHDFNNLLQIVTGNLELLLRYLPEEPARLQRAAYNAMAGAQRAVTLTQRLLAFSRRQPLAPEQLDPNRLLTQMSDLLYRTLNETIEITTKAAKTPWYVEADQSQLETAILNLAVNARDAMPDGGKLNIEVINYHFETPDYSKNDPIAAGDYVCISVTDTGEGMDEDTLDRAFEPFFTTKDVGRGTGLGLSMVYGFIKQSGGHVRIHSARGRGTSVNIYLPRLIGLHKPSASHSTETHFLAKGAGELILLCEDDPSVRSYSSDVMQELGYQVISAADGPTALSSMQALDRPLDLLFTDVVLPGGMTGADLAREAKRIQPSLKILFTSGYDRNTIVHRGRLDAGVELLSKPFTFHDLASKIRDVLDVEVASKQSVH